MRRFGRLFRSTALLVLTALGVGMAESLMADTCDASPRSASVLAPAATVPSVSDMGQQGVPRHAAELPRTCHCVHSHVVTVSDTDDAPPAPPLPAAGFRWTERALLTVPPAPRFRPPVA